MLVKVGFKWMRQTLVDLRVLKVGPRPQNTIFFDQFCQPYWQSQKNLKFSKLYPIHSSSGLINVLVISLIQK